MQRQFQRVCLILSVLILSGAVLMAASQTFAADLVVITGKSTPADALDGEMIKEIFLGKRTTWPGGGNIEFVVLRSGSVHEQFLKTYLRKTPSQFKTYWKKLMFSGRGVIPKSFASEEELLSYVAGRTGTVGYVSGQLALTSVKVLNGN